MAFVVLLASRNMDFDQSWKEFRSPDGWNPGETLFSSLIWAGLTDSAAKPGLYD